MFTIRCGMFETNSSSSHAICVRGKGETSVNVEEVEQILDNDGKWIINDGDCCYGRSPFRYLSTFKEKVLYALACFGGLDEDVSAIVAKYVPRFTGFDVELTEQAKARLEEENCYPMTYFYTDDSILYPWLKSHRVSLEDFLTSDKYFVICDGDEYCIYEYLVDNEFMKDLAKE